MKKFIATLLAIVIATPAFAQITGGVDLKSAYVLDDGVVSTPSEVVQGFASADLGKGFTFNVWTSKGLTTDDGDEIDIGFAYNRELDSGLSVRVVANHYIIRDFPSMWEVTAGVSKGPFDIAISHYTWEGGYEDGMRAQVGYNFDLSEKWSARTELTAETGLELTDTVISSADLSYSLTDNVSISGTIYVPLVENDFRGVETIIGIGISF